MIKSAQIANAGITKRPTATMNPLRALGTLLVLSSFLCLLLAGYYYLDYSREQRSLGEFLGSLPEVRAGADNVAVVGALTKHIGQLPSEETTRRMGYLNPLYGVLRARPLDVLRHGGFCGNKARLLIALLDLRRIPARLAYLYNELGRSRPKLGQPYVTAIVEARIDGSWIVLEPLLGVVFRGSSGTPATAAELAASPDLVRSQAPAWYDPELFNYRELRGVRWSKFPGGEVARALLARLVSGAWVNGIHYPWWAHRPNLLMAILAAGLMVLLLPAGQWLRRSGRGIAKELTYPAGPCAS